MVQVQFHPQNSSLWRLTGHEMKYNDLMMIAKSILQIVNTVTHDPFIDIEDTGMNQNLDEMIIFVKF